MKAGQEGRGLGESGLGLVRSSSPGDQSDLPSSLDCSSRTRTGYSKAARLSDRIDLEVSSRARVIGSVEVVE
jgi:hypothetical protein